MSFVLSWVWVSVFGPYGECFPGCAAITGPIYCQHNTSVLSCSIYGSLNLHFSSTSAPTINMRIIYLSYYCIYSNFILKSPLTHGISLLSTLTMKALFTLLAVVASTSLAHIQLDYPPPLRSKYNQLSTNIDWSMTEPLATSGSNYPCKGYLNDLGTQAGSSVATWPAGSSQKFSLVGTATHGGGSCQASLSVDGGTTFKVIHSYIGSCPLDSSYSFKVPSDAPTGAALFAWTWFNNIGNREMYMNCASVTIGAGSGTKITAFNSRPDIFLANVGEVGDDCSTIMNKDVDFPNPGLDVTRHSTALASPICPHKTSANLNSVITASRN